MKKLISIFLFIICLSLTSCINPGTSVPKGEKPTKDFQIDEYLDDNAIFEEKKECTLSGTAEKNVIIKFQLFNKSNKVILSKEVQTDPITNKWFITFTAPKGNFDSYKIKLSDEYGMYTHTFVNIKFGHLLLVAGDNPLDDDTIIDDDGVTDDENLRFYLLTENESSWIDIYDEFNQLTNYIKALGKAMLEANSLPTGIIYIPFEDTSLEEWLTVDAIDNAKPIKSFLVNTSRYNNNPTTIGDMAYIGEKIFSKLSNVNFETIIFNHEVNSELELNDTKFMSNYFQMLYTLVNKWHEQSPDGDFILLQAKSTNSQGMRILRNYQNTIMNYYSFVRLIPTYDLSVADTSKLDSKKLITRIKDVIKENKSISYFSNVIFEVNDDLEVVTSLKIEIGNTEKLLIEVVDGVATINYFNVYYQLNDELIILDIKPKIIDNFIIIDLTYEEEAQIDGVTQMVMKVYDKSKIIIEFGESDDLRNCNLFNDSGIPILPFKIKID